MIRIFNKIRTNVVLQFTLLKYLTFFVGILRVLLFSKFIGVFEFGVWSFILLFSQYFSYSNIGVNHFLTSFLSIKNNRLNKNKIVKNISISIQITIIVGITALIITYFLFDYFEILLKYKLKFHLVVLMFFLAMSQNINKIFISSYRVNGNIIFIGIYDLLNILITIPIIFFSNDNSILLVLVFWSLASGSYSLYFLIKDKRLYLILRIFKISYYFRVINESTSLLLFNFLTISSVLVLKTFVSYYYTVEEFGEFSIGFSLATSLVILIQSLMYPYYSKLINRFSTFDKSATSSLIYSIQKTILPLTIIIVTFSCILFYYLNGYLVIRDGIEQMFFGFLCFYSFSIFTTGFDSLFIANKKIQYVSVINMISLLCLVIYIFSINEVYPEKSLSLLPISFFINYAISYLITLLLMQKTLKLSFAKEYYMFIFKYFLLILFSAVFFNLNYINSNFHLAFVFTFILTVFIRKDIYSLYLTLSKILSIKNSHQL